MKVSSKNLLQMCLILSIFSYSYMIKAAKQYTVQIESYVEGKEKFKWVELISLDNKMARIEFLQSDGKPKNDDSYALTVDGGKTWVLGERDKSYCTSWNTKELFEQMGSFMDLAQGISGAELSDPEVKTSISEKGPKLLGYNTKHIKVISTIGARASILFKKFHYILKLEDDIWLSTDLPTHPIEQYWFDAMSKTAFVKIDALSQQWNAKVKGTILKRHNIARMKNIKKNKESVKHEIIEITKIKNFPSGSLNDTLFKFPSCSDVEEDERETMAKEMLQSIVK